MLFLENFRIKTYDEYLNPQFMIGLFTINDINLWNDYLFKNLPSFINAKKKGLIGKENNNGLKNAIKRTGTIMSSNNIFSHSKTA